MVVMNLRSVVRSLLSVVIENVLGQLFEQVQDLNQAWFWARIGSGMGDSFRF